MRTEYTLTNQEDVVVVDDTYSPTYTTHTRGTSDAIYRGDSLQEAAASLEMEEDDLASELMGDGVDITT